MDLTLRTESADSRAKTADAVRAAPKSFPAASRARTSPAPTNDALPAPQDASGVFVVPARTDDGRRMVLCIAGALAIHVLAMFAVPRVRAIAHVAPDPTQWVTLDPPSLPPTPVEPPPPAPRVEPVRAPRAATPVSRPTPSPVAALPAETKPTPTPAPVEPAPVAAATTATSTEGGLAVGVAQGNGALVGSTTGTSVTPTPAPAPAAEAGPDLGALRRAYLGRIQQVIGQPTYTRAMERQGLEGTVRLGVTIDATGRVTAMRVVGSSGHDELDRYALEHVRERITSLPAPPQELAWTTREVKLGFQFAIRDRD